MRLVVRSLGKQRYYAYALSYIPVFINFYVLFLLLFCFTATHALNLKCCSLWLHRIVAQMGEIYGLPPLGGKLHSSTVVAGAGATVSPKAPTTVAAAAAVATANNGTVAASSPRRFSIQNYAVDIDLVTSRLAFTVLQVRLHYRHLRTAVF